MFKTVHLLCHLQQICFLSTRKNHQIISSISCLGSTTTMESIFRTPRRDLGVWNARVLSIDFGRENLAMCIADVHVRAVTSCRQQNVPSASGEISVRIDNSCIGVTPVHWHVCRIGDAANSQFQRVREKHADESSLEGTIMDMMLNFVLNGHCETLNQLIKNMHVDTVLLEQQVGPRAGFNGRRGSTGNPPMLCLMNAIAMHLAASFDRFRSRPPISIGAQSSKKTCDMRGTGSWRFD